MIKPYWLNIDYLSDIPKNTQGLYAWYVQPDPTEADLKIANDPTIDFIKSVSENYLEYFFHKDFDAQISGRLLPTFTGKLSYCKPGFGGLSKDASFSPQSRKQVIESLKLLIPKLMPPLYIGKSKNLRRRLTAHEYAISKREAIFRSTFEAHDDDEADLIAVVQSFAKEVKNAAIPRKWLYAKVFEFGPEVDFKVVTQLETLLNRTFYPTFGRN